MQQQVDAIDLGGLAPEGGCASDELYALMVMGEEMLPEFEDGCIIVIDPSGQPEHGRYVVVEIEGEHSFRRLAIEDGRYFVHTLQAPEHRVELKGREAVRGVIVQKTGRRRKERKFYY